MRVLTTLLFSALLLPARPQTAPMDGPRRLVIAEDIALPMSSTQVEQAVRKAWPFSFGLEPGAGPLPAEAVNGRFEADARFNFRSTATNSRLQSLGVVNYHISIRAGNGQCKVLISQFDHTGNRNAPGGAVNLGPLYAGERPPDRIPGISMGTATRLHKDMRDQVSDHLQKVLKAFAAQLRKAASSE